MAKITNGKVLAEVPDERAEFLCLMTGFRLVEEQSNEVVETPKPKRGRPRKVQND